MIPQKHQADYAPLVAALLRKYYIAYLAWEERTGKTLTAILAAEELEIETVLVVTKKNALPGWHKTLEEFQHTKQYDVTNYHNAHKFNKHKYDLIILDEAHNYISSFPIPGKIWKELRPICRSVPLLYLSATPNAQGPQMLYHQFALSTWSPWHAYQNFYGWFKTYGNVYTIKANGRDINQYDRCEADRILSCVEHLFITKTREELGFEHEPEDKLHFIELDEPTREVYNTLVKHSIVELKAGLLVCDTDTKLRYALHMLEGGVAKIHDKYITLANDEKIRYIKQVFGDSTDVVIMYNYIQEGVKLRLAFNKAIILQATSYAEGVDLSMHKHLVIYSQDFSTARHTQRRARQANFKRKEAITVHFLLVKKGISHQVYKTVSVNKKNFVDSRFDRSTL